MTFIVCTNAILIGCGSDNTCGCRSICAMSPQPEEYPRGSNIWKFSQCKHTSPAGSISDGCAVCGNCLIDEQINLCPAGQYDKDKSCTKCEAGTYTNKANNKNTKHPFIYRTAVTNRFKRASV